jgi:hypothetical protein
MQIDLINFAEVEASSQITLLERGVRVPEAQYKDSLRYVHLRVAAETTWGPPIHLMRPPTCTQLARRPLQHRTQRPAVLPLVQAVSPL